MAPWYRRLVNFSDLDLFDLCERKYYYQKIQLLPQKPSAILEVGTVYHEVLAGFWGQENETDALINSVAAAHAPALKGFGVDIDGLTDELAANLRRVRSEVFRPGVIEPVNDAAIEQHFENHRTGFRGTLDLLSVSTPVVNEKGAVIGSVLGRCIIDYKTLTSDRRRSQRDCDLSPQLALYALQSGVRAAAFVEIPRNLEKPVRTRVVTYTADEQQNWLVYLTEQRRTVMRRGKNKESYRMTNRKNPLCSPLWCAHFGRCYPYQNSPELPLTEAAFAV